MRDHLEALLADDFAEFGTSGRVYAKHDVLDQLPAQPAFESRLYGFALRVLAPNLVLAVYRLRAYEQESLRSSIWRHEGGRWRMTFHQGTPIDQPGRT